MSETEASGNRRLFGRWLRTLPPKNHPIYGERVRSFVANTHILLLVLVLLGITAALSCLAAPLDAHFFLTSEKVRAWPQLFLGYFVFFIGGDPPYELSGWWGIIAYATQFGLRAFFLASVVFKLLLPKKIFRFRENVSIYWDTTLESWLLNVRLYNSSRLEVLNVKFSAYLRVPFKRNGEPVIRNLKLKITKPQSPWAVSLPKVPYTIKITLREDELEINPDKETVDLKSMHEDELKIDPVKETVDLKSIQGISIQPESSEEKFDVKGNTFLVVAATAEIPNLGKSFSETHWWRLTDTAVKLQYGAPKPVDVTPGARARKTGGYARLWPGWREFEKELNDEHNGYVFAYGSLVDKTQIRKLHSAFTPMVSMRYKLVRLKGYRRVWNVAMDNTKPLANYKRYKDRDDEFPDIFVTFLNIEEDPTSSINGVLIPVTDKLLEHLDARERNYTQEKITVPIDKDEDLPVLVYMGSKEGKERFRNGKSKGTAYISKKYKLAVENAFDSWGALQEYRQTTKEPQVLTRCLQRVSVDKEDRPLADENIREDQDAKLDQVLTAVKSIQGNLDAIREQLPSRLASSLRDGEDTVK